MRPILAVLLLAVMPAAAQNLPDLDKRVTKLERQVDRVSRRVLPKAEQNMIEPEVSTATAEPPAAPPTPPASAASVSELSDRVGAVERRQREITSTLEDQGNRLHLAEDRLAKFQADAEVRLGKLEGSTAAPAGAAVAAPAAPGAAAPTVAPVAAPPEPTLPPAAANPAPTAPATADSRFKTAYALYQTKKWPEAEAGFQEFVDKYPKDKSISAARYWLGRSAYNQAAFDSSARIHFQNYKADPKGDHAQESLFWVGQSLGRLKRNKEACQVYDLAAKVYDTSLKPDLAPQFAAARVKAGCH